MTNHVHIVAIPDTDTSMANTLRHTHGRFSQYWNTERNRVGHLWQNRYYSCPVEESVASRVIAYVENNPVRAGIVERAEDFEWSSARAGGPHGISRRVASDPRGDILGPPFRFETIRPRVGGEVGKKVGARAGIRSKQESHGEQNQMSLWTQG